MWRRALSPRLTGFAALCFLLGLLAAGFAVDAEAARKKTARPAAAKAIYDAPMRVVIVRSSDPACGTLCPQWIAAEGEITGATPAAFSRVFKQMGKRKLPVIIRSPGGSITAALEIGRMIRKRGLDVALGWTGYDSCSPAQKSCRPQKDGAYRGKVMETRAFCNSACHLVLAAGTNRYASADTFVGVHQPRTVWTREIVTYRERYRIVKGKKQVIDRKIVSRKPGKSKVTFGLDKALRKKLAAYYKDMGMNPALIEENEKASFSDINRLTPAELDTFRLRTSADGPAAVAGGQICKRGAPPANCVAVSVP
jgi:hypothetical protein